MTVQLFFQYSNVWTSVSTHTVCDENPALKLNFRHSPQSTKRLVGYFQALTNLNETLSTILLAYPHQALPNKSSTLRFHNTYFLSKGARTYDTPDKFRAINQSTNVLSLWQRHNALRQFPLWPFSRRLKVHNYPKEALQCTHRANKLTKNLKIYHCIKNLTIFKGVVPCK